MPANHLVSAHDAPPTSDRLLDSLQRWREAERAATRTPAVPGLRAIDAHRAVIEHAKGALMLRYGIDSFQAFAVLVRWSRATHTPVQTIAHTLVHGICEGNPQTELRQRTLMRWLEDQLRHNDPGLAAPPPAPAWPRTGT